MRRLAVLGEAVGENEMSADVGGWLHRVRAVLGEAVGENEMAACVCVGEAADENEMAADVGGWTGCGEECQRLDGGWVAEGRVVARNAAQSVARNKCEAGYQC